MAQQPGPSPFRELELRHDQQGLSVRCRSVISSLTRPSKRCWQRQLTQYERSKAKGRGGPARSVLFVRSFRHGLGVGAKDRESLTVIRPRTKQSPVPPESATA